MQKRFRLRRRTDFNNVRRHGQRYAHPLAVLITWQREEATGNEARFGFSASRRVGNAVERNRAKRLLREAVRAHVEQVRPMWDCLLIARQGTPTATLAEVEACVLGLLGRANILE